jgi:membrane-bound serine protease (ClpP class)
MKKRTLMIVLGLILLITIGTNFIGIWAESRTTVYVIPINGEITPAMATFFKKSIKEAEEKKVDAILVEISTLGGRVDAAFRMKEAIEDTSIPIIVYIGDRALSAGALLSISAPRIIMAPGSHMGAAEPIPYSIKAVAAIRGEFEAAAEKNGRDKTIAAAMVDKDIDIPGLSPAGSLLDITAETAKEYGYAEAVLKGRQNVLTYLGFAEANIVKASPDLLVRLAQFITQGSVAPIILAIGIIAIIIEIFTEGFGIFGVVGITALTLYFGSNIIAGYSQWWPVLLFLIGVILLLIEAMIPGFGIPGISGISAILIGIVFIASDPVRGIRNLGIASGISVIIAPMLIYLLVRVGVFRSLVLPEAIIGESDTVEEDRNMNLLGRKGVTLTTLRPSGIVNIDGTRLDAVTQGEYIKPGTCIKVIQTGGLSVIVERDKE